MLALLADIVFLVDESGSERTSHNQPWLASIVDDLDATLVAASIDARYGLVGYGQHADGLFAHSQLIGPNPSQQLFTNSIGDFQESIDDLADDGGIDGDGLREDGWDAFEHAIAEYAIREGAVPIYILVQGDQGRSEVNNTLTREGILSAIKSKNGIVNTLVPGQLFINGSPAINDPGEPFTSTGNPTYSWAPLFQLSPYVSGSEFDDIEILGVEADAADGNADGRHVFHWFDTDTINSTADAPVATTVDALQVSFDGSNTGPTGLVDSGKSILVGQGVVGGLGGQVGDSNPYRAAAVPYGAIDMTGATTETFGSALSFSFDYFGQSYSQLYVNEDGTITFNSAFSASTNIDLNDSSATRPTEPIIAALWDDLWSGSLLVKYGDFDGDLSTDLAIQWTDMLYGSSSFTDDTLTFQAVLYANGDIRLNYVDIDSNFASFDTRSFEATGGVSATVGVWSGGPDTLTVPAGQFVPGLHSIFPDVTWETTSSYVRLAWDTGGAAWDANIVDRYGASSPEANALRDAISQSLVEQVRKAYRTASLNHTGEVLLALNVGGSVDIDTGAAGVFRADNGDFTVDAGIAAVDYFVTTNSIDVGSTNSIPAGNASALQNVFKSARGESTPDYITEDIVMSIDKIDASNGVGGYQTLADGSYILELFFANIAVWDGNFDVIVEGTTLLNNYSIGSDFAKVTVGSSETRSSALLTDTGVVKRFAIDVTGGDGLQIVLRNAASNFDPQLSGLRILSVPTPPALVGDYNLDWSVNAADYTVWRDSYGQTVTPFTGADGNGDGVVDEVDYSVWALNYGASNPIPMADFNGDGVVNAADYTVWRDHLGQTVTPFTDGDANGDGVVNGIDYYAWKETYGSTLLSPAFTLLSTPTATIFVVSTTDDVIDGDYSYGNLSLREAIQLANAAGVAVTILVEEGHYTLSLSGTEAGDASYNDLDITGLVTIVGDGAGKTVIDNAGLTGVERRAFEVHNGGVLNLTQLTVANSGSGTGYYGAWVTTGGELNITDSALVNHQDSAVNGSAVHADGGVVTIRRSVVTNNQSDPFYAAAVYAKGGATLTIGESIFAANLSYSQRSEAWFLFNVQVDSSVTKVNEGNNLYDNALGGFFNTTPGTGDHLGTPDYVVTSVADTFNHADDHYALSIREAVDLANLASGAQVIWLPAWAFSLTRDRQTYGGGSPTDTEVAFGDIDVKGPLTIRGIADRTRVEWKPGVVDAVFDLLGDYNDDGLVNAADYSVRVDQNGSGSGTSDDWEVYSADGDDDGDVDVDDHAIWSSYYGSSLNLFDVDVL